MVTSSSGSGSSNGDTATIKGKERCRITVSYRDQIQKICWYGEDTPAKNIEDVIRTAFGLPHHAALLLKNSDGDVVAVSSFLPPNEIFHLQASHGGSPPSTRITRTDSGSGSGSASGGEESIMIHEENDLHVKHEHESDTGGSDDGGEHSTHHSPLSPSSSTTVLSVHDHDDHDHDDDNPSPIAIKVCFIFIHFILFS